VQNVKKVPFVRCGFVMRLAVVRRFWNFTKVLIRLGMGRNGVSRVFAIGLCVALVACWLVFYESVCCEVSVHQITNSEVIDKIQGLL